MTTPMRMEPGELTVDELIGRLKAGNRVVIERTIAGTTHEITLRFDGETYYCDTPTTLHRHDTEEAMRGCLEEQGYCER